MTDSEIIELLQMQLKTQQQQNEFLQKTIESLNQNIQSQTETIETLTEKIADLEEKLNKNSRNSSKPPSSDGYSKPNPKSLRPKSGKKADGQKGHKSSNLSVPKKVDRTVSHYPARCEKCPLFEKCRGTVCVPAEKRYTVILRELVGVIENPPPLQTEIKRGRKKKGKVLARWYLKIRSYIDSARKHGMNAFEAVKLAFAGTPALCLGF